VKLFLLCWLGATLGILGYAFWDLLSVAHETNEFTVHLDWSRIGELAHWAPRLLNAGALPLLFLNATIIGGMMSLVITSLIEWVSHDEH
jgi:hypothetical protein